MSVIGGTTIANAALHSALEVYAVSPAGLDLSSARHGVLFDSVGSPRLSARS